MAEFFKGFGKGILYIFVLPFLLVVLALYSIYGLCAFVVLFVRSIFLFFSGRSLQDDLPEDIKAREIIEGPKVATETLNATPAPEKEPEPFHVYQPTIDPFSTKAATTDPYKAATVEEAAFGRKVEPIEESETIEEEHIEEIHTAEICEEAIQDKLENTVPEINEENINKPVEEIMTSNSDVYKPLGEDDFSMDEISKDDDIDDSLDSGVSFDDF